MNVANSYKKRDTTLDEEQSVRSERTRVKKFKRSKELDRPPTSHTRAVPSINLIGLKSPETQPASLHGINIWLNRRIHIMAVGPPSPTSQKPGPISELLGRSPNAQTNVMISMRRTANGRRKVLADRKSWTRLSAFCSSRPWQGSDMSKERWCSKQ